MRKKFVVLMVAPLVFFGISFNIISHPVFSKKIENIEISEVVPKETEKDKNIFFLRRSYILPVEQMQVPNKKAGKENIFIDAKAVFAIDDISGAVLYEKNADQKVKIASLTKLATAGTLLDFINTENSKLIAKEVNYDLNTIVEILKPAVEVEGDSGYLIVGERIKAGELLKIMLIASSNDAAYAIAQDVSQKSGPKEQGIGYFVGLMNNFAAKNGLIDTHFTNSHGIDERDNYSTAKDVVELARGIYKNYPEIFKITLIDKINIKSDDGKIDHSIKNTDKLLGKLPGIIGGKTGYTDEAGESLLLVAEDPSHQHRIVAVVIGANGRFTEMERLVNWVWDTYEWQ